MRGMKRVQRRRRGGLGGGAVAGCMNGGSMMTGTSADKPPPYTRPSTHILPSPTPAIPSPSAHYSITPQPYTHPMHPITIAAPCPCGRAERNREASAKQYKHVSKPTHIPPPTSHLYFTNAISGSTPVVSQSIKNAIVPVGASTEICEFRIPCFNP